MYLDMANAGATLDPQAAAIMISQYRQNNGLGTVVVDPELMKLAEQQSQAMASPQQDGPRRKGPAGQAAGRRPAIRRRVAVENVSAGYHTLAEAFSGWRNSPPHKANMLKNGVTKLGIAASLCSKHQIQGVLDADPCIDLKQVRYGLHASQAVNSA